MGPRPLPWYRGAEFAGKCWEQLKALGHEPNQVIRLQDVRNAVALLAEECEIPDLPSDFVAEVFAAFEPKIDGGLDVAEFPSFCQQLFQLFLVSWEEEGQGAAAGEGAALVARKKKPKGGETGTVEATAAAVPFEVAWFRTKEFRDECVELFGCTDTHSVGTVKRDVVFTVLHEIARHHRWQPIPADTAADVFRTFDRDRDGELCCLEFISFVQQCIELTASRSR
eukprot:TRINITY_DN16946_c0_g1_i1.p1 TRINITY_DN16946_c0_g1~~TRINITY_DN16946_c0_g1_i1.p1  ORF type:complete len:239 (-),score=42.27 TRINITY_DN16946_c0_g1_i1:112-786(-)